MNKLELQKQYIEVKNKYDELSEKYWFTDWDEDSVIDINEKWNLEYDIKEQFLLLKELTKQIYYER